MAIDSWYLILMGLMGLMGLGGSSQRPRAVGVFVAAALATTPTACSFSEMSCTGIGCGESGVVIEFDPPLQKEGHYRFDFTVDQQAQSCELDFSPATRGGPAAPGCEGLDVRGSNVRVGNDAITEDAPFMIMGFSLPDAERVSIVVDRDGEPLVNHSFTPEVIGVEINGPGCGECPMAIETIPTP